MKGIPNYLKNVARSVVYAAADINKDLMPSVSEFTETNKDFAKTTIARLKNPLSADKISMKAITDSKIYKNVDYGIKNLMQDLKSGNFYNKEREERDSSKFYGDMFEDDFDYFGDNDSEDTSKTYSSVKESDITAGDKVIARAIEGSNAAVAGATVNALVRTSNNQIATVKANHAQMYIQNEKLFAGLHKDITVLGNALDTMYSMQYTYLGNIDSMMTKFFTNKQKLDDERNAMLKELVEMQRNHYKSALEKDRELNKQRSGGKRRYSDIIGAEGMLDIGEYIEGIKDNLKETWEGSMFGSGGLFSVDTIMADYVMSPLKAITKTVIGTIIPETVKEAKKSLNNTISGIFGNILAGMTNKASEEGPFSPIGILLNILGINTNVNKTLNLGNYEKGPVPFDGITRKAIVEVIPEHLSRIESALTAQESRVYDYDTGRFVDRKEVERRYKNISKKHMKSATYDLRDAMATDLRRETSSIRAREGASAADEFTLAQEEFYDYLHSVNGRFSPFKSASGNGISQDKYPHLYKYYNNVIRVYNNFDLDEKGRHTNYGVRTQLAGNILSSKDSEEAEWRKIESTPGNLINRFIASQYTTESKEPGSPKNKDKENGMLVAIRDSLGYNIFDHLGNITRELKWQRENWTVGGGIGGSSKKNRRNAPKVTDFNAVRLSRNEKYFADQVAAEEQRLKDEEEKAKKDPLATALKKIINHNYSDDALESFTADERDALFRIRMSSYGVHAQLDTILKNISVKDKYHEMNDAERRVVSEFITNRVLWSSEQQYSKRSPDDTGESGFGIGGKIRKFISNSAAGGIYNAVGETFTDMLYAADKAIYEMMYRAELKIDGEAGKYNGFMDMMAHKLTDTFKIVTDSVQKNIIDPLKDKLGINQDFKDRFKDTLLDTGAAFWGAFKQANKDVYQGPAQKIMDALGFGKNSPGAVRSRQDRRASIADQSKRLKDIKDLNDEDLYRIAEAYGISVPDYEDIDTAKDAIYKAQAIAMLKASNGGVEFGSKKDLAFIKRHLRKMEPDEVLDLLKDYVPKELIKGKKKTGLKKSAIQGLGSIDAIFDNAPIIDTDDTEYAEGNAAGTTGRPFMGKTMLSKGELLFNSKGTSVVKETGAYRLTEPTHILNSGDSHDLMKSIGMKPVGPKTSIHHDAQKERDVRLQMGGHAKGTINPNMTVGDLLNSENMKIAVGEAKNLIPEAAAGGVIGGLISGLFGLVGGPLLGAGVGAGASILAHSDTLKNMVFGEIGADGKRAGGFISDKVKEAVDKYLPDMKTFGLAGLIPGLLTPLGPLGGMAVGAGIGLLKNTGIVKQKFFGDNADDGILGGEEEKNILMKYGKGALKGAGVGAAVSLLMGGPFGLLGNAVLGSAFGMIGTSDEFKDAVLGEKINGIRVGGLIGKLDEAMNPLKTLGYDFRDYLMDTIDNRIIKPIHDFLVPAIHEIPHLAGLLPKWIMNLTSRKIGPTLVGTLSRIISPIAKRVGEHIMGDSWLGRLTRATGRGVTRLVTSPLRALGGAGNMLRRHQIRAGRGDYMYASQRVDAMEQGGKGVADDTDIALSKIRSTDEDAVKGLNSALALVTSLTTSDRQIKAGIKKNTGDINKTINNFVASSGKRFKKAQIEDMAAAIRNNDYQAFRDIAAAGLSKTDMDEFMASGIKEQIAAYKQSLHVQDVFNTYGQNTDKLYGANKDILAGLNITEADLKDPKKLEDLRKRLAKEQTRFANKDLWEISEEETKQYQKDIIYRWDQALGFLDTIVHSQKTTVVNRDGTIEITTKYGESDFDNAGAKEARKMVENTTKTEEHTSKAIEESFSKADEDIYKARQENFDEEIREAGGNPDEIDDDVRNAGTGYKVKKKYGIRMRKKAGFLPMPQFYRKEGEYKQKKDKLSKDLLSALQIQHFSSAQTNIINSSTNPEQSFRRAKTLSEMDINPTMISDDALKTICGLSIFAFSKLKRALSDENILNMIRTREDPTLTPADVKFIVSPTVDVPILAKRANLALNARGQDGTVYRSLSDLWSNKKSINDEEDEEPTPEQDQSPDSGDTSNIDETVPEEGHFIGTFVRGALGIGKALIGGAKAVGGVVSTGAKAIGSGISKLTGAGSKAIQQYQAATGRSSLPESLAGVPGTPAAGGLTETGEIDKANDGREVVSLGDGQLGLAKRGTDGSVELDTSDTNTKNAVTKLTMKERAQEALMKAQMGFYKAQEKIQNAITKVKAPDSPIAKLIKGLILGGFLLKSGILKKIWDSVFVPLWNKVVWPTIKDIWNKHLVPWWEKTAWPWIKNIALPFIGDGLKAIGGTLLEGIGGLLGLGGGVIKNVLSGIGWVADKLTGSNSKNTPKSSTFKPSDIPEDELDNESGMRDEKGNKLTYRQVKVRLDNSQKVYNAEGVEGDPNEDGTAVTFQTDYKNGTNFVKKAINVTKHAITQGGVADKAIKGTRFVGKVLSKVPVIGKPLNAAINVATAPGAKVTGFSAKLKRHVLNKVGEVAASKGDEVAFDIASNALDKMGATAAKQSTKKQGKIAKLVAKLKDWLVQGLNKLSSLKIFQTKIGQAAVQLGKKPGQFMKDFIEHLKSTFDDIIEKGCEKFGVQISAKIASKLTIVLLLAELAIDFGAGCDQAESILGVKDCGLLETITAGIINAIGNLIVVPALIPGIPATAQLIFKFFGGDLEKRQAEAQAEYEEYIQENQVDWSFEEYMKRMYSVTGAAGGWLSDRGRDIINGAKAIGSGIKNAVLHPIKTIKGIGSTIAGWFTGESEEDRIVKDIENGIWHYTNDLTDEEIIEIYESSDVDKLKQLAEKQRKSGGGFEFEIVERYNRIIGIASNASGTFALNKGVKTAKTADISKSAIITKITDFIGKGVDKAKGAVGGVADMFGALINTFSGKFGDIAEELVKFEDKDTNKVIEKAEKGEISIFSKDYWGTGDDVAKNTGFAGAMKSLYTNFTKLMSAPLLIVQGVINAVTGGLFMTGEYLKSSMSGGASSFSSAGSVVTGGSSSDSSESSDSGSSGGGIIASIKKNGLIGTIKAGASKIFKGIKGFFFGKGTDTHRGPRPMYGRSKYSKQIDPSIANIRFNSGSDTEYQTIGDSACGPAAAVNVVESIYGTGGGAVANAAKYALNHGYKETNGGTRPEFFTDYFRSNGLGSDISYNRNRIADNINSGMPTVVMGHDPKGTSSATPFGTTPHYVTVTGTDGHGNAIVQDPESRYDNQLYPMKNIINNTTLGVSAYGSFGRGGARRTLGRIFTGRGKYGMAGSKIVVIGDSRTVGMHGAVGDISGVTWVAQSNMGYNWFKGTALPQAKSSIDKDTSVVILMGINDGGDYLGDYASQANSLTKDAKAVFYVSINPIDEAKYHRFKNSDVKSWNDTLKSKLNSSVKWIDTFDIVLKNMKSDPEGLHYDNDTYKKIWDKITDAVGSGKSDSKSTSGSLSDSDSSSESSSSSSSSTTKKKKKSGLRFKFTYKDKDRSIFKSLSNSIKGFHTGVDLSGYTNVGSGTGGLGSFGEGSNMSEQIWWYLKQKGFTDEGAAGVLGNFEQESYNYPPQVQGADTQFSNDYTKKVNDGTVSEYDFVHKGPNGGGYGLAQWTDQTRKQGLYDMAKKRKTSVGDLTTQLEWMYQELQSNDFAGVLDTVKNATSVETAMQKWLNSYEMPGTRAEEDRRKFANEYYNEYKGTEGKEIEGANVLLDDASSSMSGSSSSSSSGSSGSDSGSSSSSEQEDDTDTIGGFFSNVLAKSAIGQVLSSFMGTGKVRQSKYGTGKYGRGNHSDQVWWYLKKNGFSDEGAAGIMGNLEQESRCYAPIVQGSSFEFSNDYTKKVDDGDISRDEFVNSGPNGGGYGLAQWTWYTRKEGLYDLAKKNKTSIADVGTQMEWLLTEMNNKNDFGDLMDKMKNATDVGSAAQTFFDVFEGAGDGSGPDRKQFATNYYNELKGTEGKEIDGANMFLDGDTGGSSGSSGGGGGSSEQEDDTDTILGFFQNALNNSVVGQILGSFLGGTSGSSSSDGSGDGNSGGSDSGGSSATASGKAADMVRIAKEEVGTAENPDGSNNIKYNDWYYGKNVSGASYPWCAAFVSWVANQAGVSTDIIPKDAYTVTAYNAITKSGKAVDNSDAMPGDIAYFTNNGSSSGIYHTGIVTDAKNGTVYTVEGNSSNKVSERDYNMSSSKLMLARPKYVEESTPEDDVDKETSSGSKHTSGSFGELKEKEDTHEKAKSKNKDKKSSSESDDAPDVSQTLGGNGEKPLSRYGTFVSGMYGRGTKIGGRSLSDAHTTITMPTKTGGPNKVEYWDYDKAAGRAIKSSTRKFRYNTSKTKTGRGTGGDPNVVGFFGRGETDYSQMIETIIKILYSIADNADKLNLIVSILNQKLGTNITSQDISNNTGKSDTLKSTLSAAVMGTKMATNTQKYTDYANSINDVNISSVMSAVNQIASE